MNKPLTPHLKVLDLYYAQKDGCKKHPLGVGKICVECCAEALQEDRAHIEKLFSLGMPAHHVLRLVAQENISAGKARELILGILFGDLSFDNLPSLRADVVLPAPDKTNRGKLETACWLAECKWFMLPLNTSMSEAVNELFEYFGMAPKKDI